MYIYSKICIRGKRDTERGEQIKTSNYKLVENHALRNRKKRRETHKTKEVKDEELVSPFRGSAAAGGGSGGRDGR